MSATKKVIIVVPCYNEEEALPHLIKVLAAIRKQLAKTYQIDILFVNDGSADGTQSVIEKASRADDCIYFRQLSHNAGHQSALRAGLNASVNYDAAIMMDADMQHPPELIADMLKAWRKGAKIVQMTRRDSTRQAGTLKYLTSRLFYKLLNGMSDLKLEYGASDFRLVDQAIVKALAASRENDLFLRGYFSWLPVSRTTIEYTPNNRVAGTSKYTVSKLFNLAYRSVIQFSEKPLRISVLIGITIALLSLLYGLFIVILYLFDGKTGVSGWTSLMVVMLFCFGINFILLGIIGSYLAHSISIEKQRPEFIVAAEKLPLAKNEGL